MTISAIAAELRVALGNCVDAKEGSVEERIIFISLRNASDEQIVALWLSLSYLRDHHVSMIVAKQGQKRRTISAS
jgi:hypothetical protein